MTSVDSRVMGRRETMLAIAAALIFVGAIGFLGVRLFGSASNTNPVSAERQRILETAAAQATEDSPGNAAIATPPVTEQAAAATLSSVLGSQGSAVGASSPEEAVEQLRLSLNEHDPVGAIAILDPVEAEAWSASILSVLADAYEDEDVLAPHDQFIEYSKRVFEALDAEIVGIDGEQIGYDVATLDPGGRLARVSIDGIDIGFVPDSEPDTALVGLLVGTDPVATELSRISEYRYELRDDERGSSSAVWRDRERIDDGNSVLRLELVTIERDGKWFVSPGYSFLEQVRYETALTEPPDFGAAFDAVANDHGAASPQDAVRELAQAFTQLDYSAGAQLMDPVLFPYAYDYLPTFAAEVNERGRLSNAEEFDAHIDVLELGTDEWRGRTVVTVDAVEGRAYGNPAIVDLNRWCVQAIYEQKNENHCAATWIEEALWQINDRETDPTILQPARAGFVMSEYGGRWFIDPLATAGWLADQVAEPGKRVFENATTSADAPDNAGVAGQIFPSGFFVAEAPIVRRGQPVSVSAVDGVAVVAIDVGDFGSATDQSDRDFALAKISVDEDALLFQQDTRNGGVWPRLSSETWAIARTARRSSELYPKTWPLAVQTEGTLTVELMELEAINVPRDGLTATIPADGRPLYFTWSGSYAARVQGAAQLRFGSGITVLHADTESFDGWYLGAILARGEPGQTFSIVTRDE